MSKFSCHYDLDQRPHRDLVNFTQYLYRLIPELIVGRTAIERGPDGLPDAVHYYFLYTAALIHGSADAALTLILHNLGREARLQERQIFECWVRAKYYSDNPEVAALALRATPFQEKQILEQLKYDKSRTRYREISEVCKQIELMYPDAKEYREPSIWEILRSNEDKEASSFYTFHYRLSSQVAHATFQAAGGVITEEGLQFDSRLPDPNLTLRAIVTYLLAFTDLLSKQLMLQRGVEELPTLIQRWQTLQAELPVTGEAS
jgi:hypothetical protein